MGLAELVAAKFFKGHYHSPDQILDPDTHEPADLGGDDSGAIAAAVAAILGSADAAGDTLGELQSLLGGKLVKSANLSDLANVSTALDSLGFSAFIKTLINDADAAAARATLGITDGGPAIPNAADDEFTALSGWTTLGTLDILNVTDIPGFVHMKRANGAVHGDGIYKACPSIPFTVTCRMAAATIRTNYDLAGLMIGVASPGAVWNFGPVYNGGAIGYTLNKWASVSSLAGATNYSGPLPSYRDWYLRMVVNSSTSVDLKASLDGYIWTTIASGVNPGFTVGSVGLAMSDSTAAGTIETVFDWIRFS